MMVYASVSVPEPDKSANDQTTYVYYDDGKTLIGSWSTVNRNIVKLDTVPKPVQDAVLSAEDRTFYTNKGVSVTGLLRAAWSNSSGGSVQGGSTITQQYVKVVLLKDSSRTISRKVKEFVIALKISREKSKEQILEDYLNSIYFGRGASGIDAAARAYFGHGAAQLTPSEGAFLAGIINGPNLYEPTDPEGLARAKDRWTYVADGMVTMGEITAQQRAQMVFPKAFVAQRQQIVGNGIEPQNRYLMQMVAAEMATHGITDEQLKTMGYRIVTTFNKKMVDEAVQAVQDKLGPRNATGKKKGWPVGTQAALVSIDPATGAVKAIYGGDGTTRFRNAATDDTAQAGSTFKPFALLAGLEGDPDGKYSHLQADGSKITDLNGGQDPLSLHSRFDGRSPQKFVGLDKPVKNAEGSYGMIDLVTATEHSVNTAYMNLNELVDPLHTQNVATRAGVPASDVKHTGVNNVLGVDDPHPIDMASAYATIAAQGVYHKPHVIAQIRTSAGGVICCQATPGETRFDKNVVADATFALQQVVKGGTGSYAGANLNRPIAGKTGTTDANVSAWFVGFTPQLSTAVSMYRIDTKAPFGPLPLKGFQGFSDSGMVGGSLPIRVWTDYMSLALKGQPVANLPTPVYGGQDQNPTPTTSTPTITPSSPSQPTGHPTWTPPTDTGTPTDTPTGGPTSTASVTLPTLTRGGKPTTSP
jgi:membrane peptidoglycan carboxypeptidase